MARARLTASIAAASLLFGTVLIAPAYAVPDYPTAEEVAKAKQNVRDKQAMIERIEGLLAELEAEAEELGRLQQSHPNQTRPQTLRKKKICLLSLRVSLRPSPQKTMQIQSL